MLKENYACGSENNFAKYCNPEVEQLLDRQSQEADAGKRKALVWEIERRLAEDVANPIIAPRRRLRLLASPRQRRRAAAEQHL